MTHICQGILYRLWRIWKEHRLLILHDNLYDWWKEVGHMLHVNIQQLRLEILYGLCDLWWRVEQGCLERNSELRWNIKSYITGRSSIEKSCISKKRGNDYMWLCVNVLIQRVINDCCLQHVRLWLPLVYSRLVNHLVLLKKRWWYRCLLLVFWLRMRPRRDMVKYYTNKRNDFF